MGTVTARVIDQRGVLLPACTGHTQADLAVMVGAGVDPWTVQPREHPVRCSCGTSTWNVAGGCDHGHYEPPRGCRR